jgi:hypothetical protein
MTRLLIAVMTAAVPVRIPGTVTHQEVAPRRSLVGLEDPFMGLASGRLARRRPPRRASAAGLSWPSPRSSSLNANYIAESRRPAGRGPRRDGQRRMASRHGSGPELKGCGLESAGSAATLRQHGQPGAFACRHASTCREDAARRRMKPALRGGGMGIFRFLDRTFLDSRCVGCHKEWTAKLVVADDLDMEDRLNMAAFYADVFFCRSCRARTCPKCLAEADSVARSAAPAGSGPRVCQNQCSNAVLYRCLMLSY